MSSPSPPAPVACAAISASEKVDGFTRKSVRKAQRQKRSQGSSQFRSQGSQPELHPLPQLKGKARGGPPLAPSPGANPHPFPPVRSLAPPALPWRPRGPPGTCALFPYPVLRLPTLPSLSPGLPPRLASSSLSLPVPWSPGSGSEQTAAELAGL